MERNIAYFAEDAARQPLVRFKTLQPRSRSPWLTDLEDPRALQQSVVILGVIGDRSAVPPLVAAAGKPGPAASGRTRAQIIRNIDRVARQLDPAAAPDLNTP
jgi:hypothetical protein